MTGGRIGMRVWFCFCCWGLDLGVELSGCYLLKIPWLQNGNGRVEVEAELVGKDGWYLMLFD